MEGSQLRKRSTIAEALGSSGVRLNLKSRSLVAQHACRPSDLGSRYDGNEDEGRIAKEEDSSPFHVAKEIHDLAILHI